MQMMVLDADLQERLLAERQESGGDRYDEVWEGVYMMAPLANNEHQDVQSGLTWAIKNAIGSTSGARVQAGANVSDRDDDWMQNYRCPDVVVVFPNGRAHDRGAHWQGGPDFCVEIVSRGDRSRDKLDFYSSIGVRELLLVDRAPWNLELYRLTGSELAPVTPTNGALASQVVPVSFHVVSGTPRPQIEVVHRDGVQRWLVRLPMRYPPELVLKVNEVFHDVEGSAYAGVHPEIFEGETARWDEIARSELATRSHPIRVLDVGCGTGFVVERIAPVLTSEDAFVCADLSQAMLDACRKAIGDNRFACRFEFAKLDGQTLGQPDGSCDVVTMNSVLHHLPDPAAALREIGRILKPGGCFIVAHEPNRRFYVSRAMRTRARLVETVASPKQTIGAVLRRLGLMTLVHRVVKRRHHSAVLDEVNLRLLDTKAIDKRLTQDELTAIVDVQSPTAGGWHRDRGIDIEALAAQHLPNFDCRLVTYDHLGSGTNSAGGVLAAYSKRLARKRPKDGATLLAVLTKKSD